MKTIEEKQQAINEWQKARLEESVFTIAKVLSEVMQGGDVHHLISEALFKGFYGYLSESGVKVKTYNNDGEEVYDDVSFRYMEVVYALFKVMDQISTIKVICEGIGEYPSSWIGKVVDELKDKVEEKWNAI